MGRGYRLSEHINSTSPQQNRPVLQFLQKDLSMKVITEKQARQELGFQSFVVFRDSLRLNASTVEDCMQKGLNNLKLGVRLHREVAKGQKAEEKDAADPDYLVKVFVTFADYSIIGREFPGLGRVVVVR